MGYNFLSDTPIYLQIIDYIKVQIICGKYKSGEKIPSVRELALELEVNPNTVQKALQQLEDEGLIFTERTNGKFVTKNADLIQKIKQQKILDNVKNFFTSMQSIGVTKDQSLEIINRLKGDN